MKTLLVPTEPHDVMTSVLETARLVQARFGSYVEGYALRPAIPDYVPIDMVSGLAWHVDEKADEEARREGYRVFTEFMAARGVPAAAPEPGGAPGWGWHPKAPPGDAFLAGHARIFDLVVLGRPVAGKAQPSMATLETVLFETGRPLLLAPPVPPVTLGETAVIAWNGSTETVRTVAYAMPFLKAAQRVVVLGVDGWPMSGPGCESFTLALRRHGIAAEFVQVQNTRRNVGEEILAQTRALGGDLLVKGAYTQSRLRQMIFGGATAHILASAEVPVIMAN